MFTAEEEINNIRLEISIEHSRTKQAMKSGVMFQEIKERKLMERELIRKLDNLIKSNKISQSN